MSKLSAPEPEVADALQADQQRRMHHAVEFHGLQMHDCWGICSPDRPLPSCPKCGGAGFALTLKLIESCGRPGCPFDKRVD